MMIDFGKILKRAWHILWNYKVLWLFGVLLAIFAGASASGNGLQYRFGSNGYRGVTPNQSNIPDVQIINHWFEQHVFPLFNHPLQHLGIWIWIFVGIVLFFTILGIIGALIRFPAEAAVIRMVDGYEATGEKVRFGAGWKLGWNHRAFRMWWVNFLTQTLPGLVLFLIIVGLGVGTFYAFYSGSRTLGATAALFAAIMIFLLALIFGVGLVFLRLLRQFYWRKLALEDTGTRASFREGWQMFKRNWKSALLFWLIMVGIKIGVGIALTIAAILFIPLYILLLIPAVIVGAIPALIAFGIASIFTVAPWSWLIGLVFGLPFFALILGSPLIFVHGLYLVYDSGAWTLAYREMRALESVSPSNLPATTP